MKKRRPIFQPNEYDATVSMRTRTYVGLTTMAIVLPFVIFGDWPFYLISVVLSFAVIEIIHCAKQSTHIFYMLWLSC